MDTSSHRGRCEEELEEGDFSEMRNRAKGPGLAGRDEVLQ